uniref:Uncharacterized protein n=1 Tax=Mucochytrium quahogii TaxID=96639 RepID=A0A7S2W1B8_9STRA|mmetsp:Transcript_18162/g.29482  ORF Transcript_18162/g.29482 Transcript_18162/m.29482 type:complete len:189 (+) Transcript_18162:372-938(+)
MYSTNKRTGASAHITRTHEFRLVKNGTLRNRKARLQCEIEERGTTVEECKSIERCKSIEECKHTEESKSFHEIKCPENEECKRYESFREEKFFEEIEEEKDVESPLLEQRLPKFYAYPSAEDMSRAQHFDSALRKARASCGWEEIPLSFFVDEVVSLGSDEDTEYEDDEGDDGWISVLCPCVFLFTGF